MPQIIYEKNAGELIPQGGRSVSTFPSGLIRVDQTFICSTPNVATHRADLKIKEDFPGGSEPAIDGLYIYPEVQESRRGDGFSELIASGYGRTADTLQNIRKQLFTGRVQKTSVVGTVGGSSLYVATLFYSRNIINGFIAIKDGDSLSVEDLGLDDQLFVPFNLVNIDDDYEIVITSIEFNYRSRNYIDWNGDLRTRYFNNINFYSTQYGSEISYNFNWGSPVIKVINSQNFGVFKELEISVS
jgi:hypothetical protein